MNARLMAICTICGFVVAALIVTPGTSAPNAAGHGLFAGLKVGQAVEMSKDGIWAVLRAYEDPEGKQLNCTITEIGPDFIACEFDNKEPGADRIEIRMPASAFNAVQYIGRGGPKRPGGAAKKKN